MSPHPGAAPPVDGSCTHDALLFASDDELVTATTPFVSDGIAADDLVIVHGPERDLDVLREAFDDDPRVQFVVDSPELHRMMPTLAHFQRLCAAENASGRGVRTTTSIDPISPDPQALQGWKRFEALVDRALAPYRFSLLCRYDVRTTPDEVLEHALAVHSRFVTPKGVRPNDRRHDPAALLADLAVPTVLDPLQAWPPVVEQLDCRSLAAVRHDLGVTLRSGGVNARQADEFTAAVNEVITNALEHAAPPTQVRLHTDGLSWLCVITDHGPGVVDPWLGVDAPEHTGGRTGLWIARQLSDQLDLVANGHGTTVALRLDTIHP